MPEVTQVQNLMPASGAGQIPWDLRQRMLAGQLAQQQATAPPHPYSSRMAGLGRALEAGLGGLMEGSAQAQAMQGQRQAGADAAAFMDAAQRARASGTGLMTPPAQAAGGSPPSDPGLCAGPRLRLVRSERDQLEPRRPAERPEARRADELRGNAAWPLADIGRGADRPCRRGEQLPARHLQSDRRGEPRAVPVERGCRPLVSNGIEC